MALPLGIGTAAYMDSTNLRMYINVKDFGAQPGRWGNG